MRRHPVLEYKQPRACGEFLIHAHVEMTEDKIIDVTLPREVHGELVQRLIGAAEDIFIAFGHPALL